MLKYVLPLGQSPGKRRISAFHKKTTEFDQFFFTNNKPKNTSLNFYKNKHWNHKIPLISWPSLWKSCSAIMAVHNSGSERLPVRQRLVHAYKARVQPVKSCRKSLILNSCKYSNSLIPFHHTRETHAVSSHLHKTQHVCFFLCVVLGTLHSRHVPISHFSLHISRTLLNMVLVRGTWKYLKR